MVALVQRPLVVVEGAGPVADADGAGGPLVKGLAQELVAGVAHMDDLGLAAALQHGRNAAATVQLAGAGKALALGAQGHQQPRPQGRAGGGQGTEQRGVRVLVIGHRNLALVFRNGLAEGGGSSDTSEPLTPKQLLELLEQLKNVIPAMRLFIGAVQAPTKVSDARPTLEPIADENVALLDCEPAPVVLQEPPSEEMEATIVQVTGPLVLAEPSAPASAIPAMLLGLIGTGLRAHNELPARDLSFRSRSPRKKR